MRPEEGMLTPEEGISIIPFPKFPDLHNLPGMENRAHLSCALPRRYMADSFRFHWCGQNNIPAEALEADDNPPRPSYSE